MPPIVSIIGESESGKTTLIEKLIQELNSRGYRIATVKHTPHNVSFDTPGKDSWRHLQAGSAAAAISTRDKMVVIKPVPQNPTLEEIARFLGEDYDLIITEGFKQEKAPKIEVRRKGVSPIKNIKKLIAVVSDETPATKTRQFSLEDTRGLADLLEKGFIKPERERISLYVNNIPIPLGGFPRQFISNVLIAMVSSLKGVEKIRSLQFFLKKNEKITADKLVK